MLAGFLVVLLVEAADELLEHGSHAVVVETGRAEIDIRGSKLLDQRVTVFWNGMKSTGAPLIETLPDRTDDRLVTFVWRGTPETKSVNVATNWEMENRFLTRLRDTDIWYLSIQLDRRLRTSVQARTQHAPARSWRAGRL